MPFNTLADDLQRLVDATDAIGQAIIDAGGTVNEYDRLEEYPADIMSINRNTTSIDITENGQYYAGEENTITTTEFPITIRNSVGTPMKHVIVDGNMQQNGTPTPQNPIQPNETGERTGNLIDISIFQDGMNLDVTTGLPIQYGGNRIATIQPINVSQYNSITVTYDELTSRVVFFIYSIFNGDTLIERVSSKRSGDIIDTSNATKLYLSLYDCTISDINYIMLNAGSEPLPYEPYGYKLEISSGGYNLFDKSAAELTGYTLSGTTFTPTAGTCHIDYKLPSGTYTISCDNDKTLYIRNGKVASGYIKQKTSEQVSVTFAYDASVDGYLRITSFGSTVSDIMLNLGSTALPYEPYNRVTAPIYLGEVPTTRRIGKLVLDGTETWYNNWRPTSGSYGTILSSSESKILNMILCTHLPQATYDDLYNGTVGISIVPGKVYLCAIRVPDTIASSDTEFKTWLAAQYAAGTPVTVWYVLATETTGVVNEPIRKIGDYVDTVSADITLPLSSTEPNIVDVNTTLKPSSASFTYNKKNDYIGYNEINVDVPNTYTVEDEGKVVNNATLVAQTAMPTEITANDTYDTTLYNSITVNIPLSIEPKDVTFYDYEGSVVYTYTKDEFLALTELPQNPSHTGLTAQGWNWSLSDAKTYVNKYGKLDIGQMYITDDGKTRIYITLTEGRISPILQLYLNDNSELDIDWGDGSTHSTFTTTTAYYVSERHNYATAGDYVIAITVTIGSFVLQSYGANVSSILWNGNDNANSPDRAYNNSIQKIEIGTGVTTIDTAFKGCYSLSSVTIPDTVTTISLDAFSYCSSLASITIPDSVTSIGSAFQNCYSLSSITIPDSVTTIDNAFSGCYSLSSITIPDRVISIGINAFANCYALASITIPDLVASINNGAFLSCVSLTSVTIPDLVASINSTTFSKCYSLASVTIGSRVTDIGTNAFNGCSYMESIKFKPITPPTVSNSNTWTGVPTSCIILVPINTYAAYTTATNYPDPSTYTYLAFGTYESGTTLPSSTTDNYMLIWYASAADAIAQTNPITTGNGNEVYARCLVDTSVTRSIDFDNNTSTLSGDPSTHPIYTNIKRCTVQDDGTITSYYGDSNYVEDGSIGQVMVYIPKFYYKVNIINKQLVDDTHPEYGYDIHEASYSVSSIKYQGYKLHPAFINANGDEVDYVLCSAFEGSTYDTSASAYNTNDAQTVDFTASTGDLLASIGYVDNSGTTVHVKPASGLTQNLTRPNSMTIAKNRGTGWYALTFKLTSAIQMLITVEYGCNSQVNIANGVVGITDNTSYNCASYVGSTVGNTTGRAASTINEINGTETTYTSATTTSVNWRGIENMWGNIWKWVDGVNIYGNGSQRGGVPYVCTDMNFSDTNTANYESVGFTVANTDGYVKYFGWGNDKYDWVFMPSTAGSGGASASTTVGDYFYKTANLNGYRAAPLGGRWNYSSYAGVFCWYLAIAASSRTRAIGARLMYVPM